MKKSTALLFGFILMFLAQALYCQLDPGMIKKQVLIESSPAGAEVFLKVKNDWELLGTTPLKAEIRIGKKEIKLVKEDYDDYLIKIDSNSTSRISAKLKLTPVTELIVKSDVKDADVFLNNKKVGKINTPIPKIKLGKYKLALKKTGFDPVYKNIILSSLNPLEVYLKMRAAPPKDKIEQWLYRLSGNKPAEVQINGTWFDPKNKFFQELTLEQEGNKITGKTRDYEIKGIVSGYSIYLALLNNGYLEYSLKLSLEQPKKFIRHLRGFWYYSNDLNQENGGNSYLNRIDSEENIDLWLKNYTSDNPAQINMTGEWKDGKTFGGWSKFTLTQNQNFISGKYKDYEVKGVANGKKAYLVIYDKKKVFFTIIFHEVKPDELKGEYYEPSSNFALPGQEIILMKGDKKKNDEKITF